MIFFRSDKNMNDAVMQQSAHEKTKFEMNSETFHIDNGIFKWSKNLGNELILHKAERVSRDPIHDFTVRSKEENYFKLLTIGEDCIIL